MEGTINTRGNINKYVGEYSDLLVHESKSKFWNNFKVLAIFLKKYITVHVQEVYIRIDGDIVNIFPTLL